MNSAPEISGVEYDTDLPILDMEQLEMLILVDEDEDEEAHALVLDLHQLFNTESREKLEGLAAACDAGDRAAVRKIVHFVAGSAGNLGLARLCAFYRGIEKGLDIGSLVDLSTLAELAIAEFELASEAFLEVLPS